MNNPSGRACKLADIHLTLSMFILDIKALVKSTPVMVNGATSLRWSLGNDAGSGAGYGFLVTFADISVSKETFNVLSTRINAVLLP